MRGYLANAVRTRIMDERRSEEEGDEWDREEKTKKSERRDEREHNGKVRKLMMIKTRRGDERKQVKGKRINERTWEWKDERSVRHKSWFATDEVRECARTMFVADWRRSETQV